MMKFIWTEEEKTQLEQMDPMLEAYMNSAGSVDRDMDDSLVLSLIHQIIAQQVSNTVQETIFQKFCQRYGHLGEKEMISLTPEQLMEVSIPSRKAQWICGFFQTVDWNQFTVSSLRSMEQDQAIAFLTQYPGIGRWSAEMILMFGAGRKDILAASDYGIRKGFSLLYQTEPSPDKIMEKQKQLKNLSTLASFYYWQAARELDEKKEVQKKKVYCCWKYPSMVGELLLVSDDKGLCHICFENQHKACLQTLGQYQTEKSVYIEQAIAWLDGYFQGKKEMPLPELSVQGSAFQKNVWQILQEIPYGQTVCYQQIGIRLQEKGICETYSARAIGQAVGKNPLGILIPCHRVIRKDKSLGGFAGEVFRKQMLLNLESAQ